MIGRSLGHYDVIGKLGEGGMGQVYRARDTKLRRDVAIKVLPEVLAKDRDRLARFEREAQLLASLSHPNIAAIFGLEQHAPLDAAPDATSDRRTALVMELVEGADLSTVIARGPLPVADALPIARQIADALEAAHEQGIVHRDLKPGNIKVRPDGTVKVLDFGLAKALAPDGASATADAQNSPTLTARGTEIGVILGTAAYMAPEQARGRPVDRRADIWAFGVVLYEMLAGRRAFEGDDVSITLASVLKEDVKWDALPSDLPPSVKRLLRRCLEKDPRKRLSAIGDARLELDESSAPVEPGGVSRASPHPRSRVPWFVAAAAVLVTLATVVFLFRPVAPVATPGRMHFEILPLHDSRGTILAPQVSPDGKWLAYAGPPADGGPAHVWVRALSAVEPQVIPETAGANSIFWSPDSRHLGYTTNSSVFRVTLGEGRPRHLVDLVNPAGGAWSPAGDIIMAVTAGGARKLVRINADNGRLTDLWQAGPDGPLSLAWPSLLPDGRHFLAFDIASPQGDRFVHVGSLDGGAPVPLMPASSTAVYAPPGFLLFMRDNTLYAQRFDADARSLSGEPMRVANDVAIGIGNGRTSFSVSADGAILAYRQITEDSSLADLVWVDRSGKVGATVGAPRAFFQIRLSPDEKRVAFVDVDPATNNFRIGTVELGNGVASMMTPSSTLSNDPVWSRDSQTVAYGANARSGIRQIFTQRVGSSEVKAVFESADDPKWVDDWSRDGKFILFHTPRPSRLFAVATERATATTLMESQETIEGAHFSPDGRWIAYLVTDAGIYQVWIASFPALDRRQQVSPSGGSQVFWRDDGRELFYLTPTGQMMSSRVTPSSESLDLAAPVELFQSPLTVPAAGLDQYAVSRDGQRFLFVRGRLLNSKPIIAVVLNWTEGLESK